MANSSTTSPAIPPHVSALLSHLTSRPGVQSTFILSRRDGSIIQSTGLLAAPKRTKSETSSPAPAVSGATTAEDSTAAPTAPTSSPTETATTATSTETSTQTHPQPEQQQQQPYDPSPAEALAAHIFAFVSSAASLSLALEHPAGESVGARTESSNSNGHAGFEESFRDADGNANGAETSTSGTGREHAENGADKSEGFDDDEVKLLRLRTKKHEIVVVPDRKYLLCVVHDSAGAGGGGGTGTATGGARTGR
ncbi:hypothetical protein BJX61DRAFT_537488 [Aspergillus egyptiacus]|nr:hypothetical protein BJX61DRAFT_537488 [Aspergillus egyptiacus]